jgi:hypothetical protein
MSHESCCSSKAADRSINVNVNVDVSKIVKYSCITGVLIVGIIFGTNAFKKMLEHGFFNK